MESNDRGQILASESGRNYIGNKLLLASVILAVLLSSVALVVALISLTRGDVSNITVTTQGSDQIDEKIWNIAIGHMQTSNIYIDEPSGQLKGFHVDIINAVCRLANKNCRLVADVFQRCWDSQLGEIPRGGEGLLAGWYDACAGWIKTYERARTFRFAKPWQKPVQFFFIVKTGNPNNINSNDVTGKRFGFVDGFANDEFCLARQTNIRGSSLSPSQIQHYPTPGDMFDAVISGEVDACIAVGNNLPPELTRLEDTVIDCSMDSSGGGLMLRMDNALVDWWDPTQDRLIQTNEYRQICENIQTEHGHMPGRDLENHCFGF